MQALAAKPQLRGVIVARPGTQPPLTGLRERGVRAARFSHRSGAGANFAGSASFDDLVAMAPALASAGMHAELWTDCKVLPDIAPALHKLPFPLVIDHMGGFDVNAGIDDPGFRALLSLVESGRAYVKMCVYRNLLSAPGREAGRPFHQALLQANPDHLLWGSDWPHLRVEPAPDAAQLLQMFEEWTADRAAVEHILTHNPALLYG